MALRTLYYNDGVTTYQAPDFMALADCLSTDGVYKSDALKVVANSPADLSIRVSAGRMKKSISGNGYVVTSDAAESVLIDANTSGYNRIDCICIKVDPINFLTTVVNIKGVPSSSPVAPVIPSNYLELAEISVGNNVSVINDNVITDKRVIAGPELMGRPSGIMELDPNGHAKQSQLGIAPILSVHNDNYDIDATCLFDKFMILNIEYTFVSGLASYITNGINLRYRPKRNTAISGFDNASHTPVHGIFWNGDGTFSFWASNGSAISEAVIRCAPIVYEIRGD